jgi:pilus assembly protein Flp/PilA
MVDRFNSLVMDAYMRVTNLDLRREEGQALTEYALVLGIIVLAVVTALTTIGGSVHSKIQKVCVALGGDATGCP